MGRSVDSLGVDGQPAAVTWDGARIALPVLDLGEHVVEIERAASTPTRARDCTVSTTR